MIHNYKNIFKFIIPIGILFLFIQRGSNEAINILKQLEGFSAIPYKDEAGNYTIGYGHKIKNNEYFKRITKEQADIILKSDLYIVEQAIRDNVIVSISDNQFNALLLLAFNIGVYGFKDSTLLDLLNNGNYLGAAKQFGKWVYITNKDGDKIISNNLLERRQKEYNLFIEG